MRGYILSIFSLICIMLFSICLFLSDNMLVFWLFLELGTLALIPSFFLYSGSSVYNGLFSYIIASGVSSSLIICGFIFENLLVLMILGFLVKFGIFPFVGWVYSVITSTNWLVVWGLSTVLKAPFLFFCFFLSVGWYSLSLLGICCILTFLFIGWLFWFYTHDWFYYWCHVMICSSAILLIMSIQSSVDLLLLLFFLYFIWASIVIFFLSRISNLGFQGCLSYFLFVSLLVSFPGSLAIFYKLFISLCVYSCGGFVLFSWILYSISEQVFLIKFLISEGVPTWDWSGVSLV